MHEQKLADVDPVADAIARAPNPLWIDGDVVSAEISEWERRERARNDVDRS